jgi:hypothetical protein
MSKVEPNTDLKKQYQKLKMITPVNKRMASSVEHIPVAARRFIERNPGALSVVDDKKGALRTD